MKRSFLRTAYTLAGALGLVLAASGQTPVVPPMQLEAQPTAGLYVGAPSCASSNCHGSTRPRQVFRVLQNEYFTWYKGGDPHYQKAFPVLFNERSKTIARNLRLPAAPAETQLCLGCHAFVVPQEKQVNRLEIEDGISCEACHGPASGWIGSHTAEDWTHEQSVAAGMTDLRDLGVRSRLCLSCHLGTGAKGVDHDLIAAGHPVLTFELDNYTEDMPAHWAPLRATHGTRAWAVGQAAAFQAGLDQLARRSRSQRWPEFSEMKCDSCHHTLAEERWKTVRAPSDRPGLPRWSPARWAVLRHLVAVAAPDAVAPLSADVDVLARQVARMGTPPAEVAETAERMSRALAGVLPRLDQTAWDDAQVKRLLLAIAGDAEYLAGADRASAQQAFLAVYSLAGQLLDRNPRLARTGLPRTLQTLNREFADPYTWNPGRFTGQLAQLKRQIQGMP